jgi:hypothetical protein
MQRDASAHRAADAAQLSSPSAARSFAIFSILKIAFTTVTTGAPA